MDHLRDWVFTLARDIGERNVLKSVYDQMRSQRGTKENTLRWYSVVIKHVLEDPPRV